LPKLISAGEKDWADVSAALPAIKAGYKTTEFWLVVAVGAGNFVYLKATGHPLPIDTNAVLGAVVAVYTAARALIKK
jgi:hypothetical protein